MVVKSEPEPTSLPKLAPAKIDQEAQNKALKEIGDHRKAIAWQVHRWPLEKRVVQEKTRLHLPRSYLSKAGEDVKTLWPGDDLNQAVHNYYAQNLVGDEEEKLKVRNCANFVTEDSLSRRRHEYLGPDPRVVGYRVDVDGELHVKWWDGFLQDMWMDNGKWTFDVRQTDDGKWVEIDD
ncbi:hypothetical protein BC835DRAFT_272387 [Cytidiella melzeri]|nr:hypothetical protein BC835DRAFT_272387 [Cytidiella melzeri]